MLMPPMTSSVGRLSPCYTRCQKPSSGFISEWELTGVFQILSTLKSVVSPVLPHLAEEIHKTLEVGDATSEAECSSAFEKPWSLMVGVAFLFDVSGLGFLM
jgi:leucyl-tRNA synthetase